MLHSVRCLIAVGGWIYLNRRPHHSRFELAVSHDVFGVIRKQLEARLSSDPDLCKRTSECIHLDFSANYGTDRRLTW